MANNLNQDEVDKFAQAITELTLLVREGLQDIRRVVETDLVPRHNPPN